MSQRLRCPVVRLVPILLLAATAACAERDPVAVVEADLAGEPAVALQALTCTARVGVAIDCAAAGPADVGGRATILGGQNVYLRLAATNISYDPGTEIFQFDATVQNLLNEAIGTPDGTTPDPEGIRVFFHSGPTATGGTGEVVVANADGVATFTGSDQPYFVYPEVLGHDAVSAPRTWQLHVPNDVSTFQFTVFVETEVQYRLVISEILVNPGGTIMDANGEWFEVYNAGTLPVEMAGLVIADSAASGRRPYHLIATPLNVAAGEYVVFGNTANLDSNGGVPLDYAYGSALTLANSLDAVKISRVVGTDTLTLDRVAYVSPAVSAQNGISRELSDLAADNTNLDVTPPWVNASVTSVYGPGGRGTPGAPYEPEGI